LHSPMRERSGDAAVEKDLHPRGFPNACIFLLEVLSS
jgi:hypothetical protein